MLGWHTRGKLAGRLTKTKGDSNTLLGRAVVVGGRGAALVLAQVIGEGDAFPLFSNLFWRLHTRIRIFFSDCLLLIRLLLLPKLFHDEACHVVDKNFTILFVELLHAHLANAFLELLTGHLGHN